VPIFEKKGIVVDDRLESVPDEQVTLFVDKGLISQVFDNLFSNAVKYGEQVQDQLGNTIKLVSYNRQIIKDFFGEVPTESGSISSPRDRLFRRKKAGGFSRKGTGTQRRKRARHRARSPFCAQCG